MSEPLDAIEQWARDTLSVATILRARDVLALVEIAKAAMVVNGDGKGEFDTRTTDALFPLRAALARLASPASEEAQ